MKKARSVWLEFMDGLKLISSRLPTVWPAELPPESTPDFWFIACRHEMSTRDSVSALARALTEKGLPEHPVSPLEGWMLRRRIEWAGQWGLAALQKGLEPVEPSHEVLRHALVTSWEKAGCVALWYNAERGGKPHPDNPDGLKPLP